MRDLPDFGLKNPPDLALYARGRRWQGTAGQCLECLCLQDSEVPSVRGQALAEDREAHHHCEGQEGDEQRVHQHELGGSTVKMLLHGFNRSGSHKGAAVYSAETCCLDTFDSYL